MNQEVFLSVGYLVKFHKSSASILYEEILIKLLLLDKPTEKAIPYEAYPSGPPEIIWDSDELRNIYTLCDIQSRYNILLKNKERIVVVHARRTDYLKNQHIINFHGPLSIDYYNEAINKMLNKIEDPIFILAADDSLFWDSVINELPQLNNRNIYILFIYKSLVK